MKDIDKWLPTIISCAVFVLTTLWNIVDRARRQGRNSEKLDTVIMRVAEVYEKVDHVDSKVENVKTDLAQAKLKLAEQGIKGLTEAHA